MTEPSSPFVVDVNDFRLAQFIEVLFPIAFLVTR
jgi:hypothetical protein